MASRQSRDSGPKILLPYQQRWVADRSPLKIWLKARQIGFSFATTYEAVMDTIARPGQTWVFLSASERQALELAEKAKLHADAIGVAAHLLHQEELVEGVHLTKHELRLPRRGRLIALPANPRTARGYAGNVVLDEFAFHPDAKRIYAAVFPFTTRGYRLIIGSTPFGESGMFYELWATANNFSKHQTDIYQAKKQGLAVAIEALRAGVHDEDIWQQEYCCQFLSDASSVIPWEQIIQATHPDASLEPPIAMDPSGFLVAQASRLRARQECLAYYTGMDIARQRDLTVVALIERVGDVFWVRGLKRLRRAAFSEQRAAADAWVRQSLRASVDSTGMGAPIAEDLQQKYGRRVEPVTFTMQSKEALVVEMQRLFQESRIRIPDDRDLRAAIHAVRKYPTATGHFRYDADRTEKGHADEFWALALAVAAASGPAVSTDYAAPGRLNAGAWMGGSRGVARQVRLGW